MADNNTMRLVLFILIIFFSVSCAKKVNSTKKDKAKLTFVLPSYTNNSAITTQEFAIPIPTPSPEGFTLSDISSKPQISCYAILASYDSPLGICQDVSNNTIASASQVLGSAAPGSVLSMDVPSGTNRVFKLIGFASTDPVCPDFKSINATNKLTMSTPFILSSVSVDLVPGEQTITMLIDFALPNKRIANCKNGIFSWPQAAKYDLAIFDQDKFEP